MQDFFKTGLGARCALWEEGAVPNVALPAHCIQTHASILLINTKLTVRCRRGGKADASVQGQCVGNTDYHEANRDLCYPFYSMSSRDGFPGWNKPSNLPWLWAL